MKRMDEMEKAHAMKAIRISFIYTMLFEISYWVMECVKAKELVTKGSLMFFLLITQGVVLLFSQFYFQKKVGDSKGIWAMVAAAAMALLAVAAGLILAKLGA